MEKQEIDGNKILEEVDRVLDKVECDYLLALFPVEETSNTMASIGLNISDADYAAMVFAKLIMRGGDIGWNLLELLQKTCKQFPLPLHRLLAASYADYEEITSLYEKGKMMSVSGGKRFK